MDFQVNRHVKKRFCGTLELSLTLTKDFVTPRASWFCNGLSEAVHAVALLFVFATALSCCAQTNPPSRPAGPHIGFLYDHFNLTLEPGERIEAAGPLFYNQHSEETHTWAFPPLFSRTTDKGTDSEEYDCLYPLLTYDRFGEQYRWALFQLLSWSGGASQTESKRERFTLFPLYFQQRSSEPAENYTALFPIYGHLKNRLFRDEISFAMFPIYGESRKKDVVTKNYLYPFYHVRHGNGLTGWQLWPLAGQEHKEITRQTNIWGDVKLIGGHDYHFFMWPFYLDHKDDIGTANPRHEQASFPFYDFLRSPKRDQTSILSPFFTWIDEREKRYREKHVPWPFVVLAGREGKQTTRVFPFYSRAHVRDFATVTNADSGIVSTNVEAELYSDFYLWPVYKYNAQVAAPLDRHRTRVLFYLYSDTVEKNSDTHKWRRRVDLFPLYHYSREFDGKTRLQVLSILEPFLPGNKSIERDYSPLWSLWRSEHNPAAGASSKSLLWNFYRRDQTPTNSHTSAFFGLYQSISNPEGTRRRICFIPLP